MTQSNGPVLLAYDGSESSATAIAVAGRLLPGREALVCHAWTGVSQMVLLGAAAELRGALRDAAAEIDKVDLEEAEKTAAAGVQLAEAAGFDRAATPRARGAQDVARAPPGGRGPSRLTDRCRGAWHVRDRSGAARQRVDRARSPLARARAGRSRDGARRGHRRPAAALLRRLGLSQARDRDRGRATRSAAGPRVCTSGTRGSPRLPPWPH